MKTLSICTLITPLFFSAVTQAETWYPLMPTSSNSVIEVELDSAKVKGNRILLFARKVFVGSGAIVILLNNDCKKNRQKTYEIWNTSENGEVLANYPYTDPAIWVNVEGKSILSEFFRASCALWSIRSLKLKDPKIQREPSKLDTYISKFDIND